MVGYIRYYKKEHNKTALVQFVTAYLKCLISRKKILLISHRAGLFIRICVKLAQFRYQVLLRILWLSQVYMKGCAIGCDCIALRPPIGGPRA